MFEIVEYEKFKSKYLARIDCAGINWATDLTYGGNIVFVEEVRADGPVHERFVVSQILYFKILGPDLIVQDKEFCTYYK